VGNLQNFTYPNGVTHAYSYDTLNRLTQVGASKNASAISNYAFSLGAAGNRLTVAELSGRSVAYTYDSLYRLTAESVTADPHSNNFSDGYSYDSVGNRQKLLVNGVTANAYTYDADDRLGSDGYDADGNTVDSLGTANTYDFENHLITHGGVTITYDGDGNRVSEVVGGLTTNYLVDTANPTGYAQVVDELQGGTVARTYSYGLERISEHQSINGTVTTSFYGYDGHGSVRQLTSSTGAVTDSYDYDAFGNIVNQTGSTPNNYLFAAEQYDPALSLYYSRARYLNTTTGRFWSMDTQGGNGRDALSLHRYLYAEGDPIDHADPSGNQIDDLVGSFAVDATLNAISNIQLPGGSVNSFVATQLIPSDVLQGLAQLTPDAALAAASGQVNLNLNNPFAGATGYAGFELLGSLKTGRGALYGDVGAGLALGGTASGGGASGMVGLVFNCPNSADYTQNFVSVTVPLGALASGTIARIETELVQVSVVGFAAGVPTAYISIISELSSISVSGTFSADKAITVFYAPFKNPDGSRPFGFSLGAGASLSVGPQQSSWATGSWSYYWQLLPSETVPFE
jgi:RHS repeat-associated protein